MPFNLSDLKLPEVNIYGATIAGYVLYRGFNFYLNRRQVNFLKKKKLPPTVSEIKGIWDVKPEEVKENNQYTIEQL